MRYLPLTNEDRKNMRGVIGIDDVNELFSNVPRSVSLDPTFNLPNHKT
ncbi:MAG: glycine dehydrogenase, partial [Alphaproteobacteria bacterium]|nr:glycine dehydrogenase [Alphaproteobacteria bacterium]